MSNFQILLDRMTAAGVSFQNQPHRLHHQWHGQLRDVFFVYENPMQGGKLDTFVDWQFGGLKGAEAAISKWDNTSMYQFVRRPSLWLHKDGDSGYGIMLMVSEDKPEPAYDILAELN